MSVPRFLCKVTKVMQDERHIEVHTNITSLAGSGYKPGDAVELRKPDGTVLRSESGLVQYSLDPEFALANPEYEPPITFSFKRLKEQDVPVGTDLWIVVEHPRGKLPRGFEKLEKSEQRHTA